MRMWDSLSAKDTINAIHLEFRHPIGVSSVWVLVEGTSDKKLFMKLLNGPNVRVQIVGGGLEQLRIAVEDSGMRALGRVIGIRDADFLHLEGKTETIDGLYITDYHDVEMMLVSCDAAFHALVCEHLTAAADDSPALRDEVLGSIAFLGGLRWLSVTEDLKLNFEGLGLEDFYDGKTRSIDKTACVKNVLGRSPDKKREATEEEVENKIRDVDDFLNLCNGHDFEKAFASHVRTHPRMHNFKWNIVGPTLRAAYRAEDFQMTELYASLEAWQQSSGHLLFAETAEA